MILLTTFGAWLIADLLSGLAHWYEDIHLIGPQRTRWIDRIRIDNEAHHKRPSEMVKCGLWQTINTSILIAWPLALAMMLIGAPALFWLAAIFAGFGNLTHRWAHTPRSRLSPAIRFCQHIGLFISREQHAHHHYNDGGLVMKENSTGNYCTMTSWLNPAIDWIRNKLTGG